MKKHLEKEGGNGGKSWKVVKKSLRWRKAWKSQGNWRKPLGKGGNCRKETLERPVGKRRTRLGKKAWWRKGKALEKARQIETTKTSKLDGEQRPLAFGPRQFARGRAAIPRKECRRSAKNGGKRRKHLKTLCTYNTI